MLPIGGTQASDLVGLTEACATAWAGLSVHRTCDVLLNEPKPG